MIVLGAAAPKPPLAIPPPSKLGGILANLVKPLSPEGSGRGLARVLEIHIFRGRIEATRAVEQLLIVIPLYNEADSIADVLWRLREVSPADIVVVDDGSVDGSVPAVRASGVRLPHLVRHRRNRGYGIALRSGFEFALEQGYDVVITFDADGQHDPMNIPLLLDALPTADIVSGSRFHPDSLGIGTPPPERLKANQRLSRLVRQYTGYEITDSACGLKLYHAAALAHLCITEAGYAMPYQVWGQAAQAGLTVCEVPVTMIYEQVNDTEKLEPGSLEETVRECQRVLLKALTRSSLRCIAQRWYLDLTRDRTHKRVL